MKCHEPVNSGLGEPREALKEVQPHAPAKKRRNPAHATSGSEGKQPGRGTRVEARKPAARSSSLASKSTPGSGAALLPTRVQSGQAGPRVAVQGAPPKAPPRGASPTSKVPALHPKAQKAPPTTAQTASPSAKRPSSLNVRGGQPRKLSTTGQALVDKFRNNPEKLEELEAILRRQRAEFAAERAAELETVSSDVVKLREVIKEIRLRFQMSEESKRGHASLVEDWKAIGGRVTRLSAAMAAGSDLNEQLLELDSLRAALAMLRERIDAYEVSVSLPQTKAPLKKSEPKERQPMSDEQGKAEDPFAASGGSFAAENPLFQQSPQRTSQPGLAPSSSVYGPAAAAASLAAFANGKGCFGPGSAGAASEQLHDEPSDVELECRKPTKRQRGSDGPPRARGSYRKSEVSLGSGSAPERPLSLTGASSQLGPQRSVPPVPRNGFAVASPGLPLSSGGAPPAPQFPARPGSFAPAEGMAPGLAALARALAGAVPGGPLAWGAAANSVAPVTGVAAAAQPVALPWATAANGVPRGPAPAALEGSFPWGDVIEQGVLGGSNGGLPKSATEEWGVPQCRVLANQGDDMDAEGTVLPSHGDASRGADRHEDDRPAKRARLNELREEAERLSEDIQKKKEEERDFLSQAEALRQQARFSRSQWEANDVARERVIAEHMALASSM